MYPVLIVEDEPAIADLIELTLRRLAYPCVQARTGGEAADLLSAQRFDLVLLDVMLPDIDGFALMEFIAPTGTPVIFVTARDEVADRVRGLQLGAYDYILKPFAPEELLARVDGLMRHTGRRDAKIKLWDVDIDPDACTVTRGGAPVELAPREYALLLTLVQNRGVALYRSVLLERVCGLESDVGPRALDLYISRLRKKLGWGRHIQTVSGIGYRLEASP